MAWSASKQFVRRRWDRKMLKSCERTIYFICSWLASSYHQIHGLRLEMIRQFIDIHDTAVHCKRLLKQTPIQVMIIFDCTYFLEDRSSSFPHEWDVSLESFTESISLSSSVIDSVLIWHARPCLQSTHLVVTGFSERIAEPFKTFVETITRCGTSWLNILDRC